MVWPCAKRKLLDIRVSGQTQKSLAHGVAKKSLSCASSTRSLKLLGLHVSSVVQFILFATKLLIFVSKKLTHLSGKATREVQMHSVQAMASLPLVALPLVVPQRAHVAQNLVAIVQPHVAQQLAKRLLVRE